MNVYQYFNSPDVAEHLRKIEHPFTAAETAYVVNERSLEKCRGTGRYRRRLTKY